MVSNGSTALVFCVRRNRSLVVARVLYAGSVKPSGGERIYKALQRLVGFSIGTNMYQLRGFLLHLCVWRKVDVQVCSVLAS
jgi:hypothetical protein